MQMEREPMKGILANGQIVYFDNPYEGAYKPEIVVPADSQWHCVAGWISEN